MIPIPPAVPVPSEPVNSPLYVLKVEPPFHFATRWRFCQFAFDGELLEMVFPVPNVRAFSLLIVEEPVVGPCPEAAVA